MITLKTIIDTATERGLQFEQLDGTEYFDTKVVAQKVRVTSPDKERIVVFHEWFERPFTGITNPNLRHLNNVPNETATINASYTEKDHIVVFNKELRFKLYDETVEQAFTWLEQGEFDNTKTEVTLIDKIDLNRELRPLTNFE